MSDPNRGQGGEKDQQLRDAHAEVRGAARGLLRRNPRYIMEADESTVTLLAIAPGQRVIIMVQSDCQAAKPPPPQWLVSDPEHHMIVQYDFDDKGYLQSSPVLDLSDTHNLDLKAEALIETARYNAAFMALSGQNDMLLSPEDARSMARWLRYAVPVFDVTKAGQERDAQRLATEASRKLRLAIAELISLHPNDVVLDEKNEQTLMLDIPDSPLVVALKQKVHEQPHYDTDVMLRIVHPEKEDDVYTHLMLGASVPPWQNYEPGIPRHEVYLSLIDVLFSGIPVQMADESFLAQKRLQAVQYFPG